MPAFIYSSDQKEERDTWKGTLIGSKVKPHDEAAGSNEQWRIGYLHNGLPCALAVSHIEPEFSPFIYRQLGALIDQYAKELNQAKDEVHVGQITTALAEKIYAVHQEYANKANFRISIVMTYKRAQTPRCVVLNLNYPEPDKISLKFAGRAYEYTGGFAELPLAEGKQLTVSHWGEFIIPTAAEQEQCANEIYAMQYNQLDNQLDNQFEKPELKDLLHTILTLLPLPGGNHNYGASAYPGFTDLLSAAFALTEIKAEDLEQLSAAYERLYERLIAVADVLPSDPIRNYSTEFFLLSSSLQDKCLEIYNQAFGSLIELSNNNAPREQQFIATLLATGLFPNPLESAEISSQTSGEDIELTPLSRPDPKKAMKAILFNLHQCKVLCAAIKLLSAQDPQDPEQLLAAYRNFAAQLTHLDAPQLTDLKNAVAKFIYEREAAKLTEIIYANLTPNPQATHDLINSAHETLKSIKLYRAKNDDYTSLTILNEVLTKTNNLFNQIEAPDFSTRVFLYNKSADHLIGQGWESVGKLMHLLGALLTAIASCLPDNALREKLDQKSKALIQKSSAFFTSTLEQRNIVTAVQHTGQGYLNLKKQK